MTKLKLFLENNGKTYKLRSEREYVVGSGSDCDIHLPDVNVASQHLKFSFNQFTNAWHVNDLGSSNGTLIDNQWIADYTITKPTRIAVASSIFLVATPESSQTNIIQQSTPPPLPAVPPPPINSPLAESVPRTTSQPILERRQSSPYMGEGLAPNLLTWKEYVGTQVNKQPNWFSRVATRFSLVTGFRNTPWIRQFSGYTLQGGNSLNAFDGYIIPDFKESAEIVVSEIEQKLGQLKQYKNTNCFVTRLTDAHIADSATQTFTGIELFPIQRGNKSDYRKFCVVSYHRVRTYLLVESYGTDLFVSWITRFEPEPTPICLLLWLIAAVVLTLVSLPGGNLILASFPLSLWCIIYLLVPFIMENLKILPKKANALLVMAIILVLYFVFFSGLLAISFGSSFSGSN